MQCCARGAEARSPFRGEEEPLCWGRLRRLGRLASLDSFSNREARTASQNEAADVVKKEADVVKRRGRIR